MILTLIRYKSDKEATLGRLFLNGKFECFTLEDEHRDVKVHGETRIPAGKYRLGLRHSPKFSPRYGHQMIWVKEVPNFEYILIHKGNTDDHTHGCILVGEGVSDMTLVNSGKAYDAMYPKVESAIRMGQVVWLVVLDYDRL